MTIEENFVETEFQSPVPIRGSCHEDFQEVAEIFAQNFKKYREIVVILLFENHKKNNLVRSTLCVS